MNTALGLRIRGGARLYADVVADQAAEPFETFEEFCERLNVRPEEYPHAFAAWLDRN